MKHLSLALSLAALSVVLFTSPAPGQGSWNALLVVQPYPSPYLSDWQSNPSIGSLTLLNNTGRLAQVKISLSITRRDGSPVANGTGRPVTVPPNPPPLILNSTQFADWGSVEYDRSVKDIAYRVGRFPEGDYRACVQLLDLFDRPLLTGPVCADFSIVYPDPPNLILPINGDTLRTQYPQFVWTPLQVPVRYQLNYDLRIVELLPGQVPSQALAANVPQYENSQLVTPNLQYPIDALPLQLGKTYAWQVQSLDQFGLPPATNQGRSQIWTFTYPTGEELELAVEKVGWGEKMGVPVPGAEILVELEPWLVPIKSEPVPGAEILVEQEPVRVPIAHCITDTNGVFTFSFPKGVKVPGSGEFTLTVTLPKTSGATDIELNTDELWERKRPTTKVGAKGAVKEVMDVYDKMTVREREIAVKFNIENGMIDAWCTANWGPYSHAHSNMEDEQKGTKGTKLIFFLIWIPPEPIKSNKGGFAVSGRNNA